MNSHSHKSSRTSLSRSIKDSDLDISNPDIRQMVLSNELQVKTVQNILKDKKERKDQYEENTEKLNETEIRNWMAKHGRRHLINFDNKERSKLKQYFNSLDADGSGSIGLDELVDPLISLGIAESVDEVQKIIDSVDDDNSKQIEFKEFLKIIGSQESSGEAGLIDFFKDMIEGRLAGGKISNKLPFNLIISTVRRKKLMSSIMSKDVKEKQEGEKVLNSYARLLAIRKKEMPEQTASTNSLQDLKKKPSKDVRKGYGAGGSGTF